MSESGLPQKSMTFIVRTAVDNAGHISGVVERVSTGRKCRFHGIAEISAVIDDMAREERDDEGQPTGSA